MLDDGVEIRVPLTVHELAHGDLALKADIHGARIGAVPYSVSRLLKLWLAALLAALVGLGIRRVSPTHHPVITGAFVLLPYGATYLLLTQWLGISSIGSAWRMWRRR